MSIAPVTVLASSGSLDLAGNWNTLWTSLTAATGFSHVQTLLAIIGLIVIVIAIGVYLFERRRGGGAKHINVLWAALAGALLSGPNVILPAILGLLDFVVNSIASGLTNIGNH